MTYSIGDEVSYLSYIDGEWHKGKIEYFTEDGMTNVAVFIQDGI